MMRRDLADEGFLEQVLDRERRPRYLERLARARLWARIFLIAIVVLQAVFQVTRWESGTTELWILGVFVALIKITKLADRWT